ncbi:LysR family transcriptional regulator [Actinophytocola oryzae]|uniref:DNA-binding transcriptional LysR family regulator n=1 Tax=Actinophytocola oryzae TaxID=502181 RepID=A0A4R7W0N8_9PSEU|nr:LysR family transcriptional regulator [Actinophytocola oryzae]TDV55952.1 DNA-binding transcriptional LysR family regulator [Actinophytocola oryzae]
MELRHLRAFRAVARTLSFTRAATELHYAQSSVTEQIQALETELGSRLFDRRGRKLELTPAGARLIEYADRVLLLVEEARSAVVDDPDEPSGELTIGALETLCAHRLPSVLARYRAACPRVKVIVREGNRGELYGAVRRGELDAGLTFGSPPADEALAGRTLAHDRLMVVAPTTHRLSSLDEVRMLDLHREPFLATEPGCGFREMYDRAVGGLGPDGPVVIAEVTSFAALCSCVAAGMGCALLPEIAVSGPVARGEVAAIPLAGAESRTTVTMTWLRRRERKSALAAFLETAGEVFTGLGVAGSSVPVPPKIPPRTHAHGNG